jgi:hypothetical protein
MRGETKRLNGWTHLNLPAIAELEEHIEIGPGQFHIRHVGDPLHREPRRLSTALNKQWDRQPSRPNISNRQCRPAAI